MAHMGFDDPRLQPSGKLDLRLSHLLSVYNKADPPPARVKPIPLTLIRHTFALQRQSTHPLGRAIADMLMLGFFYLLRPGEYAHTEFSTLLASRCPSDGGMSAFSASLLPIP